MSNTRPWKLESYFSDQKWIYCAFLKFHCFSVYFNSAEKGITLGGTWPTRRVPGVVSRCGGSRGAANSESSREGLSRLGHAAGSKASGVSLPAGYSGTGVLLGGLSNEAYGLGTRGQVACSEAFGGSLTHSTLGFFQGKVS